MEWNAFGEFYTGKFNDQVHVLKYYSAVQLRMEGMKVKTFN